VIRINNNHKSGPKQKSFQNQTGPHKRPN